MSLNTIVLAAGKGTRLRSVASKLLVPLDGRPLVAHVVRTALSVPENQVVVVVGHQAEAVEAALRRELPGSSLCFVLQREQRGTGDAVRAGLEAIRTRAGSVLVLSGDVPLITRGSLTRLRKAQLRAGADLSLLSMEPEDPGHYGRLVRQGRRLLAVVEYLDADEQIRAQREVNAGVYCLDLGFLRRSLGQLRDGNAKGEVYLTDLVALAASGRGALALRVNPEEVLGINTWAEQAALERVVRGRVVGRLMERGVHVVAPERIIVQSSVRVAPGCCLGADVTLTGNTRIGASCFIEQGAVLHHCQVGPRSRVRPYCVLEGAVIPADSDLGPLVRIPAKGHHPPPDPIHPLRPVSGRGPR